MKNPIIFMLSHLIRMLLVSILYVNISLCVCKKNHNFFIATIISFLSFILLECILEIISKVIFSNDLGIVFNILGPLSLFDSFGVIHLFFIPLISAIVSFAILYRVYFIKNKVVA